GTLDELTAREARSKVATVEALGSRRAGEHEDRRLDGRNLSSEPGPAGADLRRIGLLVESTFALGFPLEVLDRIGDIHTRSVDSGSGEGLVEQAACRANERFALDVFPVTRLLADKQHFGVRGSLTKDRLRACLVEVTGLAARCRLAEAGQCWLLRYQFLRWNAFTDRRQATSCASQGAGSR